VNVMKVVRMFFRTQGEKMIVTRLATANDLEEIMHVEEGTFGRIGKDAMASKDRMRERIALLNDAPPGWFWVAEALGRIVGDVILQPTDVAPETCASWDVATDFGSLKRTFRQSGQNLYVVSLAVLADAPACAMEFLVCRAFVEWARSRKCHLMFCSRMSGFARARQRSGIEPERYWQLHHRDGGPRDPMLNLYWQLTGSDPVKFLPQGFPPDGASEGHGVLFAPVDPFEALLGIIPRIFAVGKGMMKQEAANDNNKKEEV
jgi:hypothetical protein